MTPQGLLRWQISVRGDSHRPLAGAASALSEWGGAHPTDVLPDSGVALQSIRVAGWPAALATALPGTIAADHRPGAAPIRVLLHGPRGPVDLESPIPKA